MVKPVHTSHVPSTLPRREAQQSNAADGSPSTMADKPRFSDACESSGVELAPLDHSNRPSTPSNPRTLRHEWKLNWGDGSKRPEKAREVSPNFSSAREQLQQALVKLKERPGDRKRQEAAHRAQAALAQQPMPWLHRAVPVAREAIRMSLAGSVPTFALGRTLGMEAGKNAVPVGQQPGLPNVQRAAVQWVSSALGGAVGNVAGQTLVAPLVDMMPRQFRPVDPAALVPDRMVTKMNRIRPGWGNEMRQAIQQQQSEVQRLNSDTNIHFAEKAFSVATGVRMLVQRPGPAPTLPTTLALNSVASAAAGGSVGLNMGVNMAKANIRIPRLETLERLLAGKHSPDQETSAMADAQTAPLFYAHHTPPDERRSPTEAIAHAWHQSNLREPAPRPQHPNDPIGFPSWGTGLKNAGADLRNVGKSVAFRGQYLMQATTVPTAVGAVQPFIAASLPNENAVRMSGIALPAVTIYAVIRPWFNALVGSIPAHDSAMRARRQQIVDATIPPESTSMPAGPEKR